MNATDEDSGLFGLVTYQLVSVTNNGAGKFQVGTDGTVSVIGPVQRREHYDLIISASDSDPNPITRR